MSEARLDQIVKGAPSFPVEKELPQIPTSATTSDPLASLPSSPPQIYLNLLILEASLRLQYLELRARRQQYTFFLSILACWIAYTTYALFLAPREDGSGVGGSIYWVVEVTEKVAFMGGIVTAILVWGTGQWERGIRWPRRFVGVTNRGLRGFNCKIVLVKGSWWRETVSTISFLFPYGLLVNSRGSSYRHIDAALASELEKGAHKSHGQGHTHTPSTLPNITEDFSEHAAYAEEDLAPGGDIIKLLLLPKPFSPAFRENWDHYRTTYWEAENERRRLLRLKLGAQDKALARQQRKEWWLARFRFRPVNNNTQARGDLEKVHHHQHAHSHSLQHSSSSSSSTASRAGEKEKRIRAGSLRTSQSHSRTSSRSSTPVPTADPENAPAAAAATDGPTRRGSSASTSSVDSRRTRKKKPSASVQKLTPASVTLSGAASGSGSGSAVPDHPSPLMRQNSIGGSSTDGSSRPSTPADVDKDGSGGVRSLRMSSPGGSPARKGTR